MCPYIARVAVLIFMKNNNKGNDRYIFYTLHPHTKLNVESIIKKTKKLNVEWSPPLFL